MVRLALDRLWMQGWAMAAADKAIVITQHQSMERPLAPHFEKAYEMALQCRLNSMSSDSEGTSAPLATTVSRSAPLSHGKH